MSTFPTECTAIVTGAVSERGIGRATANYLAAQGWNVGIIDLDDALCKAAAKELAAEHGVKAFGAGDYRGAFCGESAHGSAPVGV